MGDQLHVGQGVPLPKILDRPQESVGEDRMDAVVHSVDVGRKGNASRVERGLVTWLHGGIVILDRGAKTLEIGRSETPTVFGDACISRAFLVPLQVVGPESLTDAMGVDAATDALPGILQGLRALRDPRDDRR